MADIFYNEDDLNVGTREPKTAGELGAVLGMTRTDTPLVVKVDGVEKAITTAGLVVDDNGAHGHFVINCE